MGHRFPLCLMMLAASLGAACPTAAQPDATLDDDERRFAAAYIGEISFTRFGDIVLRFDTDFGGSYVGVLAAGRRFPHRLPGLDFEVEVQLGSHWGRQDHTELNAAGLVRWSRFPWRHRLRTSIAVGLAASRT